MGAQRAAQLRPQPQGVRLRPLRARDDGRRPQRGGLRRPGLPPLPDPGPGERLPRPGLRLPLGRPARARRPRCAGGCSAVDRFGERTRPSTRGRPRSIPRAATASVDGGQIEAAPAGRALPGHGRPVAGGRRRRGAGAQLRQRGRAHAADGLRTRRRRATGRPSRRTVQRTRGATPCASSPAFDDTSWRRPDRPAGAGKLGAPGAGWVEYRLPLPETLDAGAVRGLRLRFEAGARTARNRLGWPDHLHVLRTDYPQTEARKLPSASLTSRSTGCRWGARAPAGRPGGRPRGAQPAPQRGLRGAAPTASSSPSKRTPPRDGGAIRGGSPGRAA